MEGSREWTPEQVVSLFCQAAVQSGLIEQEDVDYSINLLLDVLKLSAPQEAASLLPILLLSDLLVDYAISQGLCEDSLEAKDRFSTRMFGLVTPGPAAIREKFNRIKDQSGALAATDWFHRLCLNNDYIKSRRISENLSYQVQTPSGVLEVLINLSQPEKDPRDIIAARLTPQKSYPKCLLCRENPGYAGRPGYPARQNHHIIPLQLGRETWYFQYSPTPYYNQHCIIFNGNHQIMKITPSDFQRMVQFVDSYPHFFIGCNADLPIVGGSLITHEHFHGGLYQFPIEKAKIWFEFDIKAVGVKLEALVWPMTCIKIESLSKDKLLSAMSRILGSWRTYSDPDLGILSKTEVRHNTLTTLVRKQGENYQAYLLLRNNRCTAEHPLGIFHPHQEYHHIKKENIGLIEALGLMVLPGRLRRELGQVEDFLLTQSPMPSDSPHRMWVKELLETLPQEPLDENTVREYVKVQTGNVCYSLLCDTGVFKQDDQGKAGLNRFLETV